MKSISHKVTSTVFFRVRDRVNYVVCYDSSNKSYFAKWRELEVELYEQIYEQKIFKITDQVCFQINRTV